MHFKKWFIVTLVSLIAITTLCADNLAPVEVSKQNRINETDILAEFDGGVITRADLEKEFQCFHLMSREDTKQWKDKNRF